MATGTIQRNWDAYDIEQRVKDIRSASFNTDGTTVRFIVQFDPANRWSMLYADHYGRFAFISHHQNATAVINSLGVAFANTSISENAVYLNVGHWCRGHVLWFSNDIQSIPIVTT